MESHADDARSPGVSEASRLVRAQPEAPAELAPTKRIVPPTRETVLASIHADSLRADVEALAADAMQGRATPSPGLDAAAEHIVARLKAAGLVSPAGLTDFRQTFECGGPGRPGPAANIVGLVPGDGTTDELVIVSAHYDHVGARDVGEDRVFNGANDDASGVAAALAIAGAVARLDPPPVRGVLFVAFCGEELGLRGSKHFAAQPVMPLPTIVAAINLEMLGRPRLDAPQRAWITGMPLSDLGTLFARANTGHPTTFVDGAVVGPQEGDAFDRSDNHPLARVGVVAHSFSTGRIDELYHSVDDEPETLRYDAMVPIVRAIARGVIALADGAAVPRWSDAGRAAGYGTAGAG